MVELHRASLQNEVVDSLKERPITCGVPRESNVFHCCLNQIKQHLSIRTYYVHMDKVTEEEKDVGVDIDRKL